jgi:ceramide glucosyltransferase
MQWEALGVNADFWSQVLQAQSLKPLDFALGAVMATTRSHLQQIGAFRGLVDYLADDYQLGHQIAKTGARIILSPIVVECRSEPTHWRAAWAHQLRWARTIRVCQPLPFVFSILSNGTLWPLLWVVLAPGRFAISVTVFFLTARVLTAMANERQLTQATPSLNRLWLVPLKDLLGLVTWALALFGHRIEWRGRHYRIRPDGKLTAV